MFSVLYGLIELMAYGAEYWIREYRHIAYKPKLTTRLGKGLLAKLEKMLNGELTYHAYSPELGWTMKTNGHMRQVQDHDLLNIHIDYTATTNGQGIRADRDYATKVPDHVVRFAAYGDSFTHGDGVNNNDTWTSRLETMIPNVEVLNFGVGGYGVDQAFLRYKQTAHLYHPKVVFIGYMIENLNRHVNVFRPFYRPTTSLPLSKPRFKLEGDQLTLLPNPLDSLEKLRALIDNPQQVLPGLGDHDYHYYVRYSESPWDMFPSVRLWKVLTYDFKTRFFSSDKRYNLIEHDRYNTNTEAYHVTVALLEHFYHQVKADGREPIILIFPSEGGLGLYYKKDKKIYTPLLEDLKKRGLNHLDLMDAFVPYKGKVKIREFYAGHPTARGYKLIAGQIAEHWKK